MYEEYCVKRIFKALDKHKQSPILHGEEKERYSVWLLTKKKEEKDCYQNNMELDGITKHIKYINLQVTDGNLEKKSV